VTRFMLCVGLGFSLMASASCAEAGEAPLEEAPGAAGAPQPALDHDPGLRLPRAVHARLAALVGEINRGTDLSARD